MKAVKLTPEEKARFHFGRGVEGIKVDFASDQLFSALINNYAQLYPREVKEVIEKFQRGEIELSSLFYGLKFQPETKENLPEKSIYFLPKPILNYKFSDDVFHEFKKFKKIKYVSKTLFCKIAQNWDEGADKVRAEALDVKFLGSKFAAAKEEIEDINLEEERLSDLSFIFTSSRPKVRIDRWLGEKEKDTYFQEHLQLSARKLEGCLIKPFHYFLMKGDIDKRLSASVRVMAEEGLGGKRSIGFGVYRSCEIEDFSVPETSGDCFLSLSSVLPEKEEIKKLISYELEERSGYIYSGRGQALKKEKMRVLKSGSLFSGEVKGRIVDVLPEGFKDRIGHPVYLNGRSFLLNFGGGGSES